MKGSRFSGEQIIGILREQGACRLRQLEEENARLRKRPADAMLDNAALRDIASKKW